MDFFAYIYVLFCQTAKRCAGQHAHYHLKQSFISVSFAGLFSYIQVSFVGFFAYIQVFFAKLQKDVQEITRKSALLPFLVVNYNIKVNSAII